jgi:hypothetical protein
MVPPRIIQATVVQKKMKQIAAIRLIIAPPDAEYFAIQSTLCQEESSR